MLTPRTARRRLAAWADTTRAAELAGTEPTAPRTKLTAGRRGRSAYTTTRAEIARHYPEIDDDG